MREGALVCTDARCRREHPIIDGIPVVVADLMGWATHQLDAVLRRDDLSAFTESLIGDAAGPASALYRERSNLSGYGHGHWEDEGGFADLVKTALSLLDAAPSGAWLDTGCAVGRGTVELARRTGELAVGVDLSFGMLRVAETVRREGVARYPRRRVGLVFERREVPVSDVPRDALSFWCCDVAALPFAEGTFAGALSLNVLDCAASPFGHLLELARVLAQDAPALLSTPYDWAPTATAVEHWIGGHSQRGESGGSSVEELRRVIGATDLRIVDERDGVPWQVYANERSSVDYALHLLHLQRA